MAEEELVFSLGAHDARVRGWRGLSKWIESERAHWEWLVSGKPETDVHGFATNIQNEWTQLQSQVESLASQQRPLSVIKPYLAPLSDGRLLHHEEPRGALILDIRALAGDGPAAFAWAFLNGALGIGHVRNKDDFLGAVLAVIPDVRKAAELSARLQKERANYKEALRSGIDRLEKAAEENEAEFSATVARGKSIAARMLRRRRDSWRLHQDAWQGSADEAVETIRTTERTYAEFMQLQAPVEYWKAKAKTHADKEGPARRSVVIFFIAAGIILLLAFAVAGWFILSHPTTGSNPAPVALYIVVSSALAVLVTIAFWIGRLLTKLYLSEHHLRNDAEERAVMTTTYLALTKEKGAEEADRQIILSALFRNMSDGIVRDDGPPDLNIPGIIARGLANPK